MRTENVKKLLPAQKDLRGLVKEEGLSQDLEGQVGIQYVNMLGKQGNRDANIPG